MGSMEEIPNQSQKVSRGDCFGRLLSALPTSALDLRPSVRTFLNLRRPAESSPGFGTKKTRETWVTLFTRLIAPISTNLFSSLFIHSEVKCRNELNYI
eukprot:COSAG02_NODE_1622_length_11607_cov_6.986097_1_plen_98_part_00